MSVNFRIVAAGGKAESLFSCVFSRLNGVTEQRLAKNVFKRVRVVYVIKRRNGGKNSGRFFLFFDPLSDVTRGDVFTADIIIRIIIISPSTKRYLFYSSEAYTRYVRRRQRY